MRNIVRLARHVPRPARYFSSTARLHDSSRPLRSVRYLDLLRREQPTYEPLWHLLHCLSKSTHKNDMSLALARQRVSVDEYRRWKPIIYESDILLAVNLLDTWAFKVRPSDQQNDKKEIPLWVLLYTIAFKVRTPPHALGPLLYLFHAYIDTAPPPTRGPLFVFTMLHLARFNLIKPMNALVDLFLTTPFPTRKEEELYFNLILQSISAKPTPMQENAELVVRLLSTMQGRHLKLRGDTYETLLNDRFVTLELTKYLQSRMSRQGVVQTKEHLEAFLRVFARDGAIHDAGRYLGAVHALQGKDDLRRRANTQYLAALEDRASAFKFLHDLSAKNVPAPSEGSDNQPPSPPVKSLHKPVLHRQHSVDIYDMTSLLNVISKDLTVSYSRLLNTFSKLPGRPSIVTWTVLLRGLLLRKRFIIAERHTHKMINTGLPLDKEALYVGVLSFIRAEKPQLGVWLLERYAREDIPGRKKVKMQISAMNEIMSAFNKIQRPDVVFRLWDNMAVLYDIHPNSTTLDIVLQAARIAMRMDMSVSGALAEFKLYFSRRPPLDSGGSKKRDDAIKEIYGLVGKDPREAKVYKHGIWNGQVGTDTAREVFLRVLFSSPHSAELWDVKSPAGAVRKSINEDQAFLLPSMKPSLYKFIPPPSLILSPSLPLVSAYPGVQLTSHNFHQYILLLGLIEHSAEIPLALAWMRYLGLKPKEETQAAALAFFGEVSLQPPLVEALAGGPEKGEYARLRRWLEAWLGEEVARDEEVGRWRRVVDRLRRGGVEEEEELRKRM
ncbi:hypothetical protein BDQ17DRAFT_1282461 [Cyathus striatus]|nr:hypothetical protein BDQ17DRAFT_1282461 [Cyathus striatus]